ncbi:hypothetical protein BC01_076 [Bacillus phage BC01]|nr:hypothetical protein BC01_076 [Bacillus phage BC01]
MSPFKKPSKSSSSSSVFLSSDNSLSNLASARCNSRSSSALVSCVYRALQSFNIPCTELPLIFTDANGKSCASADTNKEWNSEIKSGSSSSRNTRIFFFSLFQVNKQLVSVLRISFQSPNFSRFSSISFFNAKIRASLFFAIVVSSYFFGWNVSLYSSINSSNVQLTTGFSPL